MIALIVSAYAAFGAYLGHRDAYKFNEILNRKYPLVSKDKPPDEYLIALVIIWAIGWPALLIYAPYNYKKNYKEYL